MKTPPFEPVRFLDLRGQGDPGEVAQLIRQSIGGPEIPVPPLKGRIRQTLRRKSVSRRRHLRALLVGGAIFVSGGVVGAVVQPILRLREQPKVEAVENVVPVSSVRPRAGRGSARLSRGTEPGAVVPEGTDETTGVPALPPPELSYQTQTPAPEPASVLPTAPRAPEPARILPVEPRPARASRPAETQERAEPRPTNALVRTPRHQEVRRGADPMTLAMRDPLASPQAAALEPAPLPPPSWPEPAPWAGEESSRALRRISPATVPAPSPVVAKPAPSTPQPSGAPPSEQALLASAIRGLRVQRSPASALAALDEYEARYSKGSMLAEVARLRAEALLLLGQRRAALNELSRAPGTGTAADEESRLVRGELAASAGRWQEALRDFDALVTAWARGPRGHALSPKLQARLERALWGRACARSHVGNEAGARADLQELLLRFPQGRFAAQATQRLGEPR